MRRRGSCLVSGWLLSDLPLSLPPSSSSPPLAIDPPLLQKPADTEKAVQTVHLYATPDPEIDPESGEPIAAPAPNDFETENFLAQASLFEAIGVGLGRKELYEVAQAVRRLGEDPDAKVATVRFFGACRSVGV